MDRSDAGAVGMSNPNSLLIGRGVEKLKPKLDIKNTDYQKTQDVYTQAQEKKIHSSKYLTSVKKKLDEISELLNFEMKARSTNLNFSVDEPTNRVVVKVINSDTGDVIREVPSEAILRVSKNIEALKGILFDGRY